MTEWMSKRLTAEVRSLRLYIQESRSPAEVGEERWPEGSDVLDKGSHSGARSLGWWHCLCQGWKQETGHQNYYVKELFRCFPDSYFGKREEGD